MLPKVFAVTAVVFVLLQFSAQAQTTRNVPSQFVTIQSAITASSNGDTVLVAPGIYNETLNFIGRSVTVQSTAGSASTVIQGNPTQQVVGFTTSENAGSVLRGFTITGGKHGILCNGSSPTIDACVITGNVSTAAGGGGVRCIALSSGQTASPTIMNTRIAGNMVVDERGGGFFAMAGTGGTCAPTIVDSVIESNVVTGVNTSFFIGGGGLAFVRASSTAGIVSPNVSRTSIRGNTSHRTGGGLLCNDATAVVLKQCRLSGNTVALGLSTGEAIGGAIYSSGSSLSLLGCQIDQNYASTFGSGVFVGGGITVGSTTIQNCTITGNTGNGAGLEVAGAPLTLVSSIVHSNSAIDLSVLNGVLSASASNVGAGWILTGGSNISADPLFVDPANGDFHLTMDSPCRDAGIVGPLINPTTDLDGSPRVVGTIDMGADEVPVVSFPGSDEGLGLFTSLTTGGDPLASALVVAPGDVIHTRLSSPDGSQLGALPILVGQGFMTGFPPTSPPGFPLIHLDGAGLIVLYGGVFTNPFATPGIPPAGFDFYYLAPPGLAGNSFRIQAFAATPFAANGSFVISDAHDLVF